MVSIYYRKSKQGKFGIYINFSFNRERYRRSLGSVNLNTAQKILAKIQVIKLLLQTGMAQIPKGICAGEFIFSCQLHATHSPIRSEVTLSVLIKEYLEVHSPPVKAKTTWVTEQIHLKRFLSILGDIKLNSIDSGLIEEYIKQRCTQVRPVTVNKEVATLRVALSWAQKKGWITEDPLKQIKPLKTKNGRRHFLTADEIKECLDKENFSGKQREEVLRFRLLNWEEINYLINLAWESDPDLAPVLVTAAYTGLRRGELSHLKWEDVDFKRNFLRARSAKQSRRHSETVREIPLHPRLRKVLLTLKDNACLRPWVFGKEDKGFNPDMLTYFFHKLVENTDYHGIGFHAFRHAFASHLANVGVDQRVIDELMGHTSEQMSRHYRHLFPQRKSTAIELLEGDEKDT